MNPRIRTFASTILESELWVHAAAVALGLLSTRFLWPAVWLSAAVFALRWVYLGKPSVRTPIDWGIALLLIVLFVTTLITPDAGTTIPQVLRTLSGILFCYGIANWAMLGGDPAASPRLAAGKMRTLVVGVSIAVLGLALFSTVSVEWTFEKLPILPETIYRPFALLVSDTVHPNVMAGTLVVLLPIPLAHALGGSWRRPGLEVGISLVALIGATLIIVLTQSRGAILAFLGVALVFPALRWRWIWIPILALLLVGALALPALDPAAWMEALLGHRAIEGVEGRLEVWWRALLLIEDFSYSGIGMGLYGPLVDSLFPFPGGFARGVPHAHNVFLQVAVDVGLPGLIAWLSIFFLICAVSWRLLVHAATQGGGRIRSLAAGLISSQVALILHGMFDSVIWGVRSAPLIWGLWGLVLASQMLISSSQADR